MGATEFPAKQGPTLFFLSRLRVLALSRFCPVTLGDGGKPESKLASWQKKQASYRSSSEQTAEKPETLKPEGAQTEHRVMGD